MVEPEVNKIERFVKWVVKCKDGEASYEIYNWLRRMNIECRYYGPMIIIDKAGEDYYEMIKILGKYILFITDIQMRGISIEF